MTGTWASWLAGLTLVIVVGLVPNAAWGQNDPSTDALSNRNAEQEALPQLTPANENAAPPPVEMPPEVAKAMKEAEAYFEKSRSELAAVLVQMRKAHTLYLNDEDRNPAAAENYRSLRNQARQLMNQTFDAALDVFRYTPNQRAATFMVTLIQHREERDIYDPSTMEGGARLIDFANVRYVYVFLAAARSAMVSGKFDLAKKLYESIDDVDDLEDCDRSLMGRAELIKEQYLREMEIREKEEQEDRLPRVKFETTQGDVLVELFIDQAPSTVANFIKLVESGFYDGLDFYQVIDHLLALTGDESGDGSSVPQKYLADEHVRPDTRAPLRGSLIMAKVPIEQSRKFVPNSAGTQFAILYLPIPTVTEQQTVFGRVIEGMDVIGSLRRADPTKKKEKTQIVLPPDRILSAEVVRRPEKLPEIKYVESVAQPHQHPHP